MITAGPALRLSQAAVACAFLGSILRSRSINAWRIRGLLMELAYEEDRYWGACKHCFD
jgi:hypothetical protein